MGWNEYSLCEFDFVKVHTGVQRHMIQLAPAEDVVKVLSVIVIEEDLTAPELVISDDQFIYEDGDTYQIEANPGFVFDAFDVFDVSRRCQKLSKAFAKNGACHIELKSLLGWKAAAEKFNDFLIP